MPLYTRINSIRSSILSAAARPARRLVGTARYDAATARLDALNPARLAAINATARRATMNLDFVT
eukprot:gene5312-1524_t